MDTITYVGLDVHKATVAVALAEDGRDGEVRRVGVFANRAEVLTKLAARLSRGGRHGPWARAAAAVVAAKGGLSPWWRKAR